MIIDELSQSQLDRQLFELLLVVERQGVVHVEADKPNVGQTQVAIAEDATPARDVDLALYLSEQRGDLTLDVEALLIVEVEGSEEEMAELIARITSIAEPHNPTKVQVSQSEAESAAIWRGRKSAFGAMGRISDYMCMDGVIPTGQLPHVLRRVGEICDGYGLSVANIFHAGDGNLHPLLVFDARVDGVLERVHAAGAEILRVSLDAGGVLSGEHGIGVEKQRFMDELFSDVDLDHQNRLRRAFDPNCRANPGKVLPTGHSCADIQALRQIPTGVWG